MKKTRKRILAAVLAITLILSGSLPVFGAESKGIGIQINGENFTFENSAKIVDGRTMVPLRSIFEAMDAEVSYDGASKTILVKADDKEISLVIGKQELTITENGATTTRTMDVAPFIDKSLGRTYVPVRFLAQSMGYSVSWDAAAKTVVIIDPATLFANVDADFSVLGKLMKSDLDMEKAYKMEGRFDMDVTAYDGTDPLLSGMNFSASGTMAGVQQKANADLTMKMALQFDKMLAAMSAEEKAQMEPLLAMFKNFEMKMKMDGETGTTYMNAPFLAAMDPTVDAKTWYKMNIYETYEQMGIDFKGLIDMSYSEFKLSDVIAASMAGMNYADVDTYQDIKTAYAFLKNLMGDDAFTKNTAGNTVTYTLKVNQTAVLAAMAKTALTEGISAGGTDLKALTEMGNLQADIMIRENGGSLSAYEVKGSGSSEDASVSFNMKGDQKNVDYSVTCDLKDIMKLKLDMESHVTESSSAPDIKLPADAVVKDYPMMMTL